MDLTRVVWAAVVAVLLGASSLVALALDNDADAVALSLLAVAASILATRER